VFGRRVTGSRKEKGRVLDSRARRQALARSIEVHWDDEESLQQVECDLELYQMVGSSASQSEFQLPLSPSARCEGAMKTYECSDE
jgi:hypothetical protein